MPRLRILHFSDHLKSPQNGTGPLDLPFATRATTPVLSLVFPVSRERIATTKYLPGHVRCTSVDSHIPEPDLAVVSVKFGPNERTQYR